MTIFKVIVIISFFLILFVLLVQFVILIKINRKLKTVKTFHDHGLTKLNEKNLREEIITSNLLKMFTIRNAVHKQTNHVHVKAIDYAPKSIQIDDELLANCFSKSKVALIHLYWELFNSYINNYWLNKNNQLKTVFSGDVAKRTGDVGKMIIASEQLVKKLDNILEEIQKEDKK